MAGGLIVSVLKSGGEPEQRVLVEAFGRPVAAPFEPSALAPAVLVRWGPSVGGVRLPVAVDAEFSVEDGRWVEVRRDGVGPMAGGRFVFTSDGRFARALEPATGRSFGAQPVALHDRWEGCEEYAAQR